MWSRIPTSKVVADSAVSLRGPWRRIRGAVSTLLVLMLIAWITAQAISRTAGFRKLAADFVSGRWGIPAEIGRSAWQWNGALQIGDVRLGEAANPAFRARHVRLEFDWPWRPGRVRGLVIEDAELQLTRTPEGEWQPRRLADFATHLDRWVRQALPGPSPSPGNPPSATVPNMSARGDAARGGAIPWPRLTVRRGQLSWRDADGSLLAQVEGLHLEAAATRLQGRLLLHVRFAADHLHSLRGEELNSVRAELLWVDDHCLLLDIALGSAAP